MATVAAQLMNPRAVPCHTNWNESRRGKFIFDCATLAPSLELPGFRTRLRVCPKHLGFWDHGQTVRSERTNIFLGCGSTKNDNREFWDAGVSKFVLYWFFQAL